MDWRHYTKLPGIKDLPLFEQKRRYMEMLVESEESIKQHQLMIAQQTAVANPRGYAAGAPDHPVFTAAAEILTQNGFLLTTQNGINLVFD